MELKNFAVQYINFLPCSERNVKIIEHYFDLTRVLSPDQKKMLRSVVVNNETSIYKYRGMGATTAIDAFLAVEAFMSEEPMNIFIMCPWMNMCEEHNKNFRRFLEQLPISLNEVFTDEKIYKAITKTYIELKNGVRIFFDTPRPDKLCGLDIDYMVFDECNLLDTSYLAYVRPNGKKITINTDFSDLRPKNDIY